MLHLKRVGTGEGGAPGESADPEVRVPAAFTRFVIGRDPGNDWATPDPTLAVSARHCEIVATAAGPVLRDLSTNGTFVNGSAARLVGDHCLRNGDRFTLGPYTVEVQGIDAGPHTGGAAPPGVARPVSQDPPQAPPQPPLQAPPRVVSAGRGGDPAAMLAQGGVPERPGLTEILRGAAPAEDSAVEMTRIRTAPHPPPLPAAAAATAAPPAATPADAWLQQLAVGLGLPPGALAGRDPAQAALQAGGLARTAITILHRLLAQQAPGSRMPNWPALDAQALRDAATPEAAVQALMALVARPNDPARR